MHAVTYRIPNGCGQCEEIRIKIEETAGDAATAPTYREEEHKICKRCRLHYDDTTVTMYDG